MSPARIIAYSAALFAGLFVLLVVQTTREIGAAAGPVLSDWLAEQFEGFDRELARTYADLVVLPGSPGHLPLEGVARNEQFHFYMEGRDRTAIVAVTEDGRFLLIADHDGRPTTEPYPGLSYREPTPVPPSEPQRGK